jgi:NADPH:quinone reductase-like Zn-dependent oxidoreductase
LPVTEYLEEKFGDFKFDVVIDALGIQEIWDYCALYLKESGLFVTVGVALADYTLSSMFEVAYLMILKNVLLPVWLGGVPRKYVLVTALVTSARLQELGKLMEEGKLKVTVDSVWEMVDVQKVGFQILVEVDIR